MTQGLCVLLCHRQLNLTPLNTYTHTHAPLLVKTGLCKYVTMLLKVREQAWIDAVTNTFIFQLNMLNLHVGHQYLLSTLATFIYRLEKQCRRWMTSRGQSTWSLWTRRNTSQMMFSEIKFHEWLWSDIAVFELERSDVKSLWYFTHWKEPAPCALNSDGVRNT